MIWVHSLLIFCAGILAVVFRNGTYRFMGVRSWIGKQVCRYSSDRKENLKYLYPYEDVQKMFDRYCEEGGTQMTFMVDVLMEVYKVSGFFSENQAETMDAKMEEVKEQM